MTIFNKDTLEMNHFIDLNNNVNPTTMLHGQVFIGKVVLILLSLTMLIVATSIGTLVLILLNVVSFLWNKVFMCCSTIQIITLVFSIGTSVMLMMFFYEVSQMIDKYTEKKLNEKKENELKELNEEKDEEDKKKD
jgi:hypothetical protein